MRALCLLFPYLYIILFLTENNTAEGGCRKGAGIKMDNTQITYELKNYQQKLNFEIDKLKLQLVLAERKLERTGSDVYACLAMVAVPICAEAALNFLRTCWPSLFMMLALPCFLLKLLWIVTMPFTSFALMKSILIKKKNKDTPDFVWQKPDVRRIPPKSTPEAETTYLAEQKKLTWVLGKYFLYQEHLQQLLQQAGEADGSLTLETARAELKAMPFYEEIKPANPFKKDLTIKNISYSLIALVAGIMLFFSRELLSPYGFSNMGLEPIAILIVGVLIVNVCILAGIL